MIKKTSVVNLNEFDFERSLGCKVDSIYFKWWSMKDYIQKIIYVNRLIVVKVERRSSLS